MFNYDLSSGSRKNTFTGLKTPQNCLYSSYLFFTNHGQKSWDTFAFLGCFPIHTGPAPPLTPQTMLDACIQNFFRVSRLYRVGGGRTARNFPKGCTVLRGNREMTEKYEYCSTVPRTFVPDCSSPVFPLSQESKRVGDREVRKKGGTLPRPPLSHALLCGCQTGFLSSKFQS